MATIKQQGDGKYSVRIGNQKFNGLSQQEAQRRADINYQAAPDSQTDSVKQKARNAALGVNPGDSNAIRDSAINSGTLVAKDINLPSAPTTPKFTYDSILNTAVGSDPSVETTETTGSNVDQGSYDLLQSYLSGQKQQPNLMDIQNKLEKDNKLKQKREAKNNYQTQLNTIVAKSQADQLSVTGQGRGIPEVIIGGQQSQIAKEAAIQALPIQALLSAASDDLATAEAHVDKLFQIYAQDAENSVKFYNDQARTVYDFLSKKEQDKVDAIKDQKKFEQSILASKIDAQQNYAMQALKDGNTVLFNRLSSIQPPTDVNSASYQEDLESYNTKVTQAITKYSIRPTTNTIPTIKTINGVDYQWNPTTQSWETPQGIPESDNGGLGGLRLQPAYNSLEAAQKTKADSLNNLIKNLTSYRVKYDQLVTDKAGSNLLGSDSAELSADLNSLLFAAAQAEGTGALQAADREVLEKVLPNPTSGGLFKSIGRALKGGKSGGLKTLDSQISKYQSNLATYGLVPVYEEGTVIETN